MSKFLLTELGVETSPCQKKRKRRNPCKICKKEMVEKLTSVLTPGDFFGAGEFTVFVV